MRTYVVCLFQPFVGGPRDYRASGEIGARKRAQNTYQVGAMLPYVGVLAYFLLSSALLLGTNTRISQRKLFSQPDFPIYALCA